MQNKKGNGITPQTTFIPWSWPSQFGLSLYPKKHPSLVLPLIGTRFRILLPLFLLVAVRRIDLELEFLMHSTNYPRAPMDNLHLQNQYILAHAPPSCFKFINAKLDSRRTVLLEPKDIHATAGNVKVYLCAQCYSSLSKNNMPQFF